MTAWLARLKNSCLDAVYPRECSLCGSRVPPSGCHYYLCASCEDALPWIEPPCCSVCAAPFAGLIEGERVCPKCKLLKPAFARGRALFELKGSGRALVHVLKYSKGDYLASDLGRLVFRVAGFRDFLSESVLVPVPLFSKKERKRGYNQSEIIACSWAKEVCGCQVENLLIRRRATPSQTGLSGEERAFNVKNAFAINKKALLDPAIRYILVDDVFTTGSTLNACAKVLCEAGACSIDIAVMSHG